MKQTRRFAAADGSTLRQLYRPRFVSGTVSRSIVIELAPSDHPSYFPGLLAGSETARELGKQAKGRAVSFSPG